LRSGGQQKDQFAQARKTTPPPPAVHLEDPHRDQNEGGVEEREARAVRYDLDGKLEKTPIDGAPAPAAKEEAGGRGRRGGGKLKEKVIEKKKDEFAELLQNLGQLVGSYAHMPPDKMQAFAANATMTPKQGDAQDQLLIQRKSALQAGDTMNIWVDPKSYMFRGVEIQTSFEEKPVHFKGDFQPLTTGPTYSARSVLQYPDKEIELIVENYDYQKLDSRT
jgi:hypothetical protein